jgi:hypothetical protein
VEAAQGRRVSLGYRLLPLDCPQCGAGLAAEGEDVVYYCTACRSGFRLREGEEAAGAGDDPLARVEVAFVTLPGGIAARYLPFWLLPARVALAERKSSGGSLRGLLRMFTGGPSETGSPAGEGTFAVPAFAAPLAEVAALAARYTQALPRLGERLGERLTGGTTGVEDARKLAHFTLIASEAEKPDTLQDLRYTIDFGPARLLGVPFVDRGGRLVDAHFGLAA